MNVNFKWVNAHQKEPNINKNSDEYKKLYGNYQADMLAQNARNKNWFNKLYRLYKDVKNYKLKNNLSRYSRITVSYKIKQKHVNFFYNLLKKINNGLKYIMEWTEQQILWF